VAHEKPNPPTRWLTLSRQIVIGLTAGIASLPDHWILGRTAVPSTRRWSVIKDLLHRVD